MVRLAQKKDLPEVLTLLKEFHSESLDKYNLFCNDETAKITMKLLYRTSFVLVIDNKIVGVLGGIIATYPLNNELIYHEWIWFVNKKHRLHGIGLYRKLEEYCREQNIKKIVMVTLADNSIKLEKFYRRLGFTFLEKHYIKELNN